MTWKIGRRRQNNRINTGFSGLKFWVGGEVMTFSRAFLVFLLAGITTYPTTGNSQANSPLPSPGSQISASPSSNQTVVRNLTNPFSKPDASSGVLQLRNPQLGFEAPASANNDVCYTMRSYKVKRTERRDDNQSSVRGYSTCEMASSYWLRSAEGNTQQPVRLK
jgi:hypothetical protein